MNNTLQNIDTEYQNLFHLTDSKPHKILGLLTDESGSQVIRIWRPGAEQLQLEIEGKTIKAKQVCSEGLFEVVCEKPIGSLDYKIYQPDGSLTFDPYSFEPTLGDVDLYLYAKGEHYDLYRVMGARVIEVDGVKGVRFTVWAPSASRVSIVGDFNSWDGRLNPLSLLGQSGVWEIFVPGLQQGARYKFEIRSATGNLILKSDPFALAGERRPKNSSVVSDYAQFQWTDQKWMEDREDHKDHKIPMATYEVHLGSWRQNNGQFYNYRELAHLLSDYVLEMGFTHIELLPVTEHPLDESWGYQVTGYFAPTSRHGTIEDFQYFVNIMHEKGIGVILDWVPAHFPTDVFSLGNFDGSALYEHEDPQKGYHPHWNTLIFEFGHPKVSNFLIASALFWLKEMHIDGLRVDAVASMLYLDYGRNYGEWNPNPYGGKEYIEAIDFFKHLNSVVHERVPGALMIAEESSSFPGITTPVQEGGLGFDMKWNMGWMNDSLVYFSTEMDQRPNEHHHLTFSLVYMFTENFVAALSHDEVVHEKKTLLGKMPGDIEQKFANLRLLYSYMVCQPGKYLIFMGGEFGQFNEWNCNRELDWMVLELDIHRQYHQMVKQLNHFYQKYPALWEKDFTEDGFEWVVYSDRINSVLAYLRKGDQSTLLCVHNFQPKYHSNYYLKLPGVHTVKEVFNTDSKEYGGTGKNSLNEIIVKNEKGHPEGVIISISPLATQIFEVELT
ncbi:MAG: 1,4-alpha-glucan branching enzyme GlgB [Chlamydiae bacterium]|nr:1,4-alpha-glucan branching enzyme GlgB [Chlamydiota bacterium]